MVTAGLVGYGLSELVEWFGKSLINGIHTHEVCTGQLYAQAVTSQAREAGRASLTALERLQAEQRDTSSQFFRAQRNYTELGTTEEFAAQRNALTERINELRGENRAIQGRCDDAFQRGIEAYNAMARTEPGSSEAEVMRARLYMAYGPCILRPSYDLYAPTESLP